MLNIKFSLFLIISFIFVACGSTSTSQAGSEPFITTWKTDNKGKTDENQIEISTDPEYSYNFNVDWGDGSTNENVTESIVHTYDKVGVYTVKISGEYPHIYFVTEFIGHIAIFDDRSKILSVEQWGNIEWKKMLGAFKNCKNLNINAIDKPNLQEVINLSSMFESIEQFNSDISHWDVSHIIIMRDMFKNAKQFNQDISNWNVSHVEDMYGLFEGATSFNQDISNWDTSKVKCMSFIFKNAKQFNQNISNWNVSQVEYSVVYDPAHFAHVNYGMEGMFSNVTLSTDNYDALLLNWSMQAVHKNIYFDGGNSKYSQASKEARDRLINEFGWTITDGGMK